MDEMAILIDVSKCTACRSCQVACKNWNQLKAEKTTNRGSHENPPDLSSSTWNRIRFHEAIKDGRIDLLFINERCRHCAEPPCVAAAEDVPGAIIKDPAGPVVITEKAKQLNAQDIRDACPFDIPRFDETGQIFKCTMCADRVLNGLKPACVQACSTGALSFGPKPAMLALAEKSMKALGESATLYPSEDYNVLWVLPEAPETYNLAKAPDMKGTHYAGRTRKSTGLLASLMDVFRSA
ncbi:MAG TPA: formate dehydrogenase [Thermodesulfobacteriota bacterium]|nr:formate dehydrogenase [Deltaproteobacteria bacterium]HNR12606.1 formate dehydrogenase [Thermodesulfobacteriota bacterium]HNU72375.1 formate dehydrogenase [Thermodesulfobacteriota bacterium]HOC38461.1 formate dehydrogenase [Thermodesulfobacteriota bacterium]HQO77556.1 formate dehydrogenase [Thermodesulfobacteriota bacterium]